LEKHRPAPEPTPATPPHLPFAALHQLRAAVADFVGRETEVAFLLQALDPGGRRDAVALVNGVRGLGGMGKTELAYTVAAQLAAAYTDAQIVLALRGASASPLTPTETLQTEIRAFALETRLPEDLTALEAIYRSLLTGKHVLILADDAGSTA
jgi:hypothetical protein